jgi:curli biogenesis system outer membrane secretion channel CsgG
MIYGIKKACYIVSISATALVVFGCSTVKIPVSVLRPAEINMSQYKQIGVGEIGGNLGQDFGNLLKNKLVEGGVFKVVDRQRLDQIMKEANLSKSDLTDEKSRGKLGKLLTASVLVYGSVQSDYSERLSQSNGTCFDGKTKYACTRYTRTGKMVFNGAIDFIDAQTGEIFKNKILNASYTDSTGANNAEPGPVDKGALAGKALQENIATVIKAIQPWKETVMVPFKKDGDIPLLENGINQAKIGSLSDSIPTFLEAIKSAEGNSKISVDSLSAAYFDLALAYAYTYEFNKASDAINKAYSLKAETEYLNGKATIDKLREEKATLDEHSKKI